ncbi:MAG: FtsW/RodA/SpoVE family cell cycle protein [Clostridia bacterium]
MLNRVIGVSVFKRYDYVLLLLVIALTAFGFVVLRSATMTMSTGEGILRRQLMAIAMGMGICLVLSLIDYTYFKIWGFFFYGIIVLMLIYVIPFGYGRDVAGIGTNGWILIGNYMFQPAELGKIAYMMAIPALLERLKEEFRFDKLLLAAGAAILPLVLIYFQPEMGMVIVLGFGLLAILFVYGIKYRYMIAAMATLLVSAPLIWFFGLKEFQRDRLKVFFNQEHDLTSAGYQADRARTAIGSGQWTGSGLYSGLHTQSAEGIPVKESDFIFAVIGEELGFIGSMAVILLITGILIRCLYIAGTSKDYVSEAVHVNLVGYMSRSRVKAADLYHFIGDGGSRDYSAFEGNEVFIYNVDSEEKQSVGRVEFWMKNQTEERWNLTGSDVWTVDFSGFNNPGTYRLVVDGVGSSQDFEIRDDIYRIPYKISILGYYYMRIGEDRMDMVPVPRRPLWIQDVDPPDTKIIVTDMHPYHPEWNTFSRGDVWDRPEDWEPYVKEGRPTNPNAIGGHSDALDWDRHLSHVVNVYDLLLAYILSDGALDDDDLRIGESGNGIPDILDEARNEVDFWLNLRYRGGYSHGVTNPDSDNRLYQAGNTVMAAWANALNSSMMSYSFQIAGLGDLASAYQDSDTHLAW